MRLRRSPVPFLVALLLASAVLFPCPAQAAAISIDGRAVGSDGRGIAGARVELRPILSRYAQGVREALGQGLPDPEARTVTGTDGRFTLRAPRAGMWEVTVSATGFVPFTGRLLPLREAASLPDSELRRDADGPPLLGDQARPIRREPRRIARIVVQEADGGAPPGVVVRDPTSLLVLGQIPPGKRRAAVRAGVGTYLLLETADGRRALVPPAAAALAEVRILLPRPAARTGLVLDAATGRPLAGAQVWTADDPAAAVTSDATGHYRLETSVVGRSGLAAAAAGHADAFLEKAPGPLGDLPVFSLAPTIPFGGRVVDERGQPVADAVLTADTWTDQTRTRSRADGRFRFPHLRTAAPYRLTARHPGFAPDGRDLLPLTASSPEPRVVLHRGTAVAGTAVDEAGRPVAGAAVEVIGSDPTISALPESIRTETGADGSFFLRDLPPARFRLSIVRPSTAPFVRDGIEAGPAGATTDLGRIVLPDGSTLAGRVHDPQGRPLAGVRIWIVDDGWSPGPDTVTREDGTFTLAGIPPRGGLFLDLCREGSIRETVNLKETQEEPLDVTLRPAARIAGRILGPDGAPLPGASVFPIREPRDWGGSCGLRITQPCDPPDVAPSDGEGRFVVPGLEPGAYAVQVLESGFARAEVAGLRVHAGEELGGVEIRLEPAAPAQEDADAPEEPRKPDAEVRGRVVGPDGEPVAGALVNGSLVSTPSAADGTFSVLLHAAGGTLTAHARGYGAVHAAVSAAPAEGVEIRLAEEVTLSGTILGPSPQEMPWVRLSAEGADGESPGAVAADGAYRIRHLSPGHTVITAWMPSAGTRREIEIPSGQREVPLDLDLRSAPTSEVRGRVTGPGREPVPGARVVASRQDGLPHEALARADGTFVLRLEDGTWSGAAYADGYVAGSADPLEVSGGAAPVEIRMERAAVLHGQFPGLAADEVPAVEASDKSGSSRTGKADPDGGYLIPGLEPGTWTVTGRLHFAGTWNAVRKASGQVTLQPGGGDAFLDLDFAIGSLTLTARAPEGGKIAEADLLRPDGTVLFSTGLIEDPAVRFDRLRPGAYRLRWTLERHNAKEQEVILTADREVVLGPWGI